MFYLWLALSLCSAGDGTFNMEENYPPSDTLPRTQSAQDFDETVRIQMENNLKYLRQLLKSQLGQKVTPQLIEADTHLNSDQKQKLSDDLEKIKNNLGLNDNNRRSLVTLLALASNQIELILQTKQQTGADYNFLSHLKEVLSLILRDTQDGAGVATESTFSIFSGDLVTSPVNKQILDRLYQRLNEIKLGQNIDANKKAITSSGLQAYGVVTKAVDEIVRELKNLFRTNSLKSALSTLPYLNASPEKMGLAYDMLNTPIKDRSDRPRVYGTKPFMYSFDDLRVALETYNPVQSKSWLKRQVLGVGKKIPKFEEIQGHRNKILGLITVIKLSVAKIMALNEIKNYNTYFTDEYKKLLNQNNQKQDLFSKQPRGSNLSVSQPNVMFDRNKNEIWILSLDGGGIRGIIGATILDEISKRTGKHPAELFDLFAGTSTGGIIAIGLTVPQEPGSRIPRNSTQTLLSLYTTQGGRIFPPYSRNLAFMKYVNQVRGFAYKAENLEGVFKQYFGDYRLSNAVKPVLVTSVSFSEGRSVTFSSRDGLDPKRDLYAWLAARATSAAPSYFPPASFRYDGKQGVFVDGGITTNDPVYEALIEARKIYPNAKKINILSIGTGEEAYTYDPNSVNTGLGGLAMSFLIGMRDGEVRAKKQMKRYARELEAQGVKVNYIRLNPQLTEAIELDKIDQVNVEKLKALGRRVVTDSTFIPEVAGRPHNKTNVDDLRRKYPIWSFSELAYALCQFSQCQQSDELRSKITQPGFNASNLQSKGMPAQTSASFRGIPPSKPQEFQGDHGIRVYGFDKQGRPVS